MSTSKTVIYHEDCADGFGAAYAAWLSLGNGATYIAAKYGDPLPRIHPDSTVYILDFSYPRDTMQELLATNNTILLDHHKSSQQDLKGLDSCFIDTRRSGAALAWQHFHPNRQLPTLLAYVEDRDLWKWELSNSRAVNAYIYSQGYDFRTWQDLHALLDTHPQTAVEAGRAIIQVQKQQLEALTKNARYQRVAGHMVPTVYAPILQSEIGEKLLELHPQAHFAAIYYDREDARKWSLRSRAGFDVSEIAKSMGGGGHPQAAGFTEPIPA